MIQLLEIMGEQPSYCSTDMSTLINSKGYEPYAENVLEFLSQVSREILSHESTRMFPDVASFGFWCRKGNLKRHKKSYKPVHRRIGRGLVLHVAPANVPVNFAFSLAFGLIAGNINIVRLPSERFQQTDFLLDIFSKVINLNEFIAIKDRIIFVNYDRNSKISECLSNEVNARVIWGGDQTVKFFRSLPTKPRCIDVFFPDRYSMCLLDAKSLLLLPSSKLNNLVSKFCNDALLFQQNGCSSPHLINWIGSETDIGKAQNLFWAAVTEHVVSSGVLAEKDMLGNLTHAFDVGLSNESTSFKLTQCDTIFRMSIKDFPDNIETFKSTNGFFCETATNSLDKLRLIINEKYQTITYYGIEPAEIADFVTNNGLLGIDRIVPVGSAFEMDIHWDGYDIVFHLSRCIEMK